MHTRSIKYFVSQISIFIIAILVSKPPIFLYLTSLNIFLDSTFVTFNWAVFVISRTHHTSK
jgi:hypothetical protein